jgi:hypothetical protein
VRSEETGRIFETTNVLWDENAKVRPNGILLNDDPSVEDKHAEMDYSDVMDSLEEHNVEVNDDIVEDVVNEEIDDEHMPILEEVEDDESCGIPGGFPNTPQSGGVVDGGLRRSTRIPKPQTEWWKVMKVKHENTAPIYYSLLMYNEAAKEAIWQEAMQQEVDNLKQYGVFVEEPLPPGKKAVKSGFVF